VFGLFTFVQVRYTNRRDVENKNELSREGPSHAGGIVYRLERGTIQYLLVGPHEEVADKEVADKEVADKEVADKEVADKEVADKEWLLPKGHIEHNEGHGEAALREVREETGVVAQLIGFVGTTEFKRPEKKDAAKTKVYLQKLFKTPGRKDTVKTKVYLMQRLFKTTPGESRRVDWFEFNKARKLLTHDQNKYLLEEAEKERARLAATARTP
jgi:ADP-ribose pyrophosphatase YjhB (NUDIX family)